MPADPPRPAPLSVLLLGGTGTIGRATAHALVRHGHSVTCFVRHGADTAALPSAAAIVTGEVTASQSLAFDGQQYDAVVSCLASRSGSARDAWAVDCRAHVDWLAAAKAAGVAQFVLLSAICVQKPQLEFQHAKLAFEAELAASGLTWSIVRPTAYFKSLSGQIARVQRGKPFLLFGNGRLTACLPISDDDLADYLCACLTDTELHNRILPIGGPGDAITPREQGGMLFELLEREPRFRQVSPALLLWIARGLELIGRVVPAAARKAELARIGHYYATESMLVWDAVAARYDAASTPSTGHETLREHYQRILSGEVAADLGEHAVF